MGIQPCLMVVKAEFPGSVLPPRPQGPLAVLRNAVAPAYLYCDDVLVEDHARSEIGAENAGAPEVELPLVADRC